MVLKYAFFNLSSTGSGQSNQQGTSVWLLENKPLSFNLFFWYDGPNN